MLIHPVNVYYVYVVIFLNKLVRKEHYVALFTRIAQSGYYPQNPYLNRPKVERRRKLFQSIQSVI